MLSRPLYELLPYAYLAGAAVTLWLTPPVSPMPSPCYCSPVAPLCGWPAPTLVVVIGAKRSTARPATVSIYPMPVMSFIPLR